MSLRKALLPCVFAAFVATGCSAITPAAAVVNGKKISESSLQEEIDRVRDDPSFRELLRQQGDQVRGLARRQVLTRFIRETLIEVEARSRGVRVTDAEVAGFISDLRTQVGGQERYEALLQQANLTKARVQALATRQVYQRELEQRVTSDVKVDDARVSKWYDENKAAFSEYHLLRMTLPSADAAGDAAAAAATTDFAQLARQRSTDPARERGGDIGYVQPQSLSGVVGSQIEGAAPGALIGPVQASTGHELYKLLDKRIKPLDEVRDRISSQLLDSDRAAAFDSWIAKVMRAASISVNPKYGRFDRGSLAVTQGSASLRE
jgi:parvulin-like peptidyl-prolyl isomerase